MGQVLIANVLLNGFLGRKDRRANIGVQLCSCIIDHPCACGCSRDTGNKKADYGLNDECTHRRGPKALVGIVPRIEPILFCEVDNKPNADEKGPGNHTQNNALHRKPFGKNGQQGAKGKPQQVQSTTRLNVSRLGHIGTSLCGQELIDTHLLDVESASDESSHSKTLKFNALEKNKLQVGHDIIHMRFVPLIIEQFVANSEM